MFIPFGNNITNLIEEISSRSILISGISHINIVVVAMI